MECGSVKHFAKDAEDRVMGLAGGKEQHKDMGNEAENYLMKKGEWEWWHVEGNIFS